MAQYLLVDIEEKRLTLCQLAANGRYEETVGERVVVTVEDAHFELDLAALLN